MRLSKGLATAAALLLLLSACAGGPSQPRPQSSAPEAAPSGQSVESQAEASQSDTTQTGIASWYGARYHGRTTASGEPFDMNAMTAAHRSLPFGTKVRVTNLENGRSAVLRINDRGPFVDRRIIDVSRHAADHLGFRDSGLAKVRVEVI